MTADAFAQAITVMCRQKPFRPFQVEFYTMQRLLVTHPEAIALCRVLYPATE